MSLLWIPGAWLNIVSGLLMAALGGLLLAANPRKDWNRLFSLLAVFWGIQIVALNAVRITTSEAFARFAGELGLAFLVPLYFFVVMFAAVFPRPAPPFGTGALPVTLLLVPAGATLAMLFVRADLLLAGVRPAGNGAYTMVWGPAFPHLVVAPLYAAFFYALFVMMRRLDDVESPIERRQVAFVLAALAAFVAYNVPVQLHLFGLGALRLRPAAEAQHTQAVVIALVMLVGLALLVGLAARLIARTRHAATRADRREARLVLAAIAAPFLVAMAAVATLELAGRTFDMLGIVRSGSVALIVYGIVRYQLFDIDVRVKHLAVGGAAILAAAAVAVAAASTLRRVDVSGATGGLIVTAAALVTFLPALRLSARLADRVAPGISREGDHLYLRKLDVYRAGVEATLREGHEPRAKNEDLVALRARLGLEEREHALVVNLVLSRADGGPPAPDLRPGGLAFGKYLVEEVLADGGYGRVFLARDRVLDRRVVIKQLQARWRNDPNVVATFLREARIAGRLNHPNIVTVHDVIEHAGDHYIVMEHLEGGNLATRLKDGALTIEETLRVARAVLAALSAAHAEGVVHRDVKPANVLLGARGEIKLADFGIAQLSGDEGERTASGLTTLSPAPVPGTLQYMSPEQARGLPVDARSDLYAVGVLLYRALTGRHPMEVKGLDELAARAAIAAAQVPPPARDLPEALDAALRRALEPDPAARWPSAEAFARALLRPDHGPTGAEDRPARKRYK